MKKESKLSIILGGVTVAIGYAIIIINFLSLRKSKKISKMVD